MKFLTNLINFVNKSDFILYIQLAINEFLRECKLWEIPFNSLKI